MGRTTPVLNYEKTAIIAASNQTSAVVDVDGNTLCGIFMPTGFEGTSITFAHCSTNGGTFVPIKNAEGDNITAVVAADSYVALQPSQFAGVRFLKVKSAVTETAERTLILAVRSV